MFFIILHNSLLCVMNVNSKNLYIIRNNLIVLLLIINIISKHILLCNTQKNKQNYVFALLLKFIFSNTTEINIPNIHTIFNK